MENKLKRMLFTALLLALVAGFAPAVTSQEQLEQPVNEVFQNEMVYPQEKGGFQFTSTSIFSKAEKNFSNHLALEYGLSRRWQINLEWESYPGCLRLSTDADSI
jgi:hypothetical protein